MSRGGELAGARGAAVVDRDGRTLGTLAQLYVDADSGDPRWLEIAGGLHGMARHLAPAAGARLADDRVALDVAAALVHHSPTLDPGDGLTADEVSELASHYGIDADIGAR